jgi:predicted DNA-binding transcriptional regulator YafY
MYNPATRLLTILELLQSHDLMSGTELARRLEVDKRSIRRYIVMLQDIGIPIEGTPGLHGGYRLRSGFKLPPLMLTENEATVVTLGLLGIQRLGLTMQSETIEAAIAKIQRVLPQSVRERVQALDSALALDNPASGTVGGSEWLLDLTEATARNQSLLLRYRAESGEETTREVDPYGVATRLGLWYLVGFCHLRDGMRMFRLDRILQLDSTDQSFVLPPNFDCLRYVMESVAAMPARWPVEILLRLSLAEAEARIPPGYAMLQPISDGVRLGGQFNDLDAVTRFLVSLGCRFVVVEPDELRVALRRLGQEMIDLANAKVTGLALN